MHMAIEFSWRRAPANPEMNNFKASKITIYYIPSTSFMVWIVIIQDVFVIQTEALPIRCSSYS